MGQSKCYHPFGEWNVPRMKFENYTNVPNELQFAKNSLPQEMASLDLVLDKYFLWPYAVFLAWVADIRRELVRFEAILGIQSAQPLCPTGVRHKSKHIWFVVLRCCLWLGLSPEIRYPLCIQRNCSLHSWGKSRRQHFEYPRHNDEWPVPSLRFQYAVTTKLGGLCNMVQCWQSYHRQSSADRVLRSVWHVGAASRSEKRYVCSWWLENSRARNSQAAILTSNRGSSASFVATINLPFFLYGIFFASKYS